MLGKRLRRVTRNQRSQLIEVGTIERAGTTDRQPDTMNRQRVVLADPAQVMVECAAFDQIVLGMDFEEPEIGQRIENLRSEEHTSELQSLMRISYAVFCLKKKKKTTA